MAITNEKRERREGHAPVRRDAERAHTVSATRPWPVGLVHAVLALGAFGIGTTEFATMSVLPAFAHDLGVSAPTGGHAISAYALGVVIGAPVLAVLGARVSRRTLLAILMAWFAIGNALSAIAPSFAGFLFVRFLTGLPHGAYFGIAALVAAGLVPRERRTAAVGRVMLGLTIATIAGVPVASAVARSLSWRWSFAAVAFIALATMAGVLCFVARGKPAADASPLRELGALRRRQVWLTLAIGAIGFGGMFAVYTYLASTLVAVTHAPAAVVPAVFAIFGVGMTLGTFVVPRFADRALMPTVGGLLVWSATALALYPLAAAHLWSMMLVVAAVGVGGGLGSALQTRLMDVAGDAQGLAAALNHSAFNTANALGPFFGGLTIAAGYGWTSTGWVGCALALAGLLIWAISLLLDRSKAHPVPS